MTRRCSEPRCPNPATRIVDCRLIDHRFDRVEVCDHHAAILEADLARIGAVR